MLLPIFAVHYNVDYHFINNLGDRDGISALF